MAIQDDVSNFFDRMLESGRQDAGRTDRAISVLPELDGRVRSSLEMYYQPEQYGSLEEAMRFDPSLVDRVMEAYDQQAGGLLDGATYPDATMPDTSGAVPRPRPDLPTVPQTDLPTVPQTVYPTNNPTISLTDEELMQFEPVPYARANEIQTLLKQADVMQGRTRQDEEGAPGTAVSMAGLASEEMIDSFDDKERAAYARYVRDMSGASGAANMRPDGAEPRSALVNSQIQAVIDRERGANRGRVGNQMMSEDEKAAVNFGLLAAPGAAGVVRGAQAAQRLGGLRALLNRIGIGNLSKARQATNQTQWPIGVGTRFVKKPTGTQPMRDPSGRFIAARNYGPQQLPYGPQPFQAVKTPAQLRTQAMLDAAKRAPGGYADGGRLRDGVIGIYDRM